MHTACDGKITVRQALVTSLGLIRANSKDVTVIDEAWRLEKQFRSEMAELEKEEKELHLDLRDQHQAA